MVIIKHILKNRTSESPTIYQLIIDPNIIINGFSYNEELSTLDTTKQPKNYKNYKYKISAVERIGYNIVGSGQSGITRIKKKI